MTTIDWIPAHETARYTVLVKKVDTQASGSAEPWRTFRTLEEAEAFIASWLDVYRGGSASIVEYVKHAVRRKGKAD